MPWQRYAIYYTPTDALADFGAAWLGWDIERGENTSHPAINGLTSDKISTITQTPRRYGFHATLKPPFLLAPETTEVALINDLGVLAADQSEVLLTGGLRLATLHGFPALIPAAPSGALIALAARLVQELDHHRAPLSAKDRARRNPERLTDQQRNYLDRWGYPWVMDEFRFHMTLGDRLSESDGKHVIEALQPVVSPLLPDPYPIDAVTLAGEDRDGYFHQIARFPLRKG